MRRRALREGSFGPPDEVSPPFYADLLGELGPLSWPRLFAFDRAVIRLIREMDALDNSSATTYAEKGDNR